jgi:hypothetical protein
MMGFSAALSIVSVAGAQSPVGLKDGPAPDEVVVTGKAEATAREIEKQARAITQTGDPLARFTDAVCPGVAGLPEEVAGIVIDRFRQNAQRVGAWVASAEKCTPNVILAFVQDGRANMRTLLERQGFLFANLENEELRQIEQEAGPVWSWSVTALRSRDSERDTPGFDASPVSFQGISTSLGPLKVIQVAAADSRILLASRFDIKAAVVIFDIKAIDGLSAVQIADYASMRALAKTRPMRADAAASTILGLFEPGAPHPYELTAFDLAYLRSLYDASSNVPAAVKIAGVSRMLRLDEARAAKASAPAN